MRASQQRLTYLWKSHTKVLVDLCCTDRLRSGTTFQQQDRRGFAGHASGASLAQKFHKKGTQLQTGGGQGRGFGRRGGVAQPGGQRLSSHARIGLQWVSDLASGLFKQELGGIKLDRGGCFPNLEPRL